MGRALWDKDTKSGHRRLSHEGAGGRQAGGSGVPHASLRRSRAVSVSRRGADASGLEGDVGALKNLLVVLEITCLSRDRCQAAAGAKDDLGGARTRETAPAV